jgi:hypothetical protein
MSYFVPKTELSIDGYDGLIKLEFNFYIYSCWQCLFPFVLLDFQKSFKFGQ